VIQRVEKGERKEAERRIRGRISENIGMCCTINFVMYSVET
jgi:hypothetical protein